MIFIKLNRYEFEILTFLEKNGSQAYSLRTISDTLKISGSQIEKCLTALTDAGFAQVESQSISITAKGLEALEPYRVKSAVILAAGYGQRMNPATLERPKPMVTVGGVRIIDTLLDALVKVGITDITLVRGYKKEKFDDLLTKYPFLTLVDNDDYDHTNNISSVVKVIEKVDACYLCEADLFITNPDIITKYQYASNILGSYSLETDDWCFRQQDGFISDYKKGNTYCFNYYGISYWTKEDSAKLRTDFCKVYNEYPDGKDCFWEFIPLVLLKDNYQVEIRPCHKSDIIEIDSYHELQLLDDSYPDAE